MTHPRVVYIDNGGLDGITTTLEVVLDKLPLKSECKRFRIPEDYMDRLEKLLGDGRATVTFGLEVKTNEDFGNSAGASVFVKLTCDQSEAMVNETRAVAQELAELYVEEGQARAKRILDGARGITTGDAPPEEPVETKPAPASSKPKVVPKKAEPSAPDTETDPEPRAQAAKPAGARIKLKKPNFRR